MFNNKKELALALMSGKRFRAPDGVEMYYDEESNTASSPFRILYESLQNPEFVNISMEGYWMYFDEVTLIKEWYNDIPEPGILCCVSDLDPLFIYKIVRVIHKYDGKFFLARKDDPFKYARPLTEKEASELTYTGDQL